MPVLLNNKEILNILNYDINCDKLFSLKKKLLRSLKKIKTASAKSKGRFLQKWVCGRVANIFGVFFDQKNDQCDIHSREMGQRGVDVILRGDLLRKFPFSIECKNSENLNLNDTIKQARLNAVVGTNYLIVHKRKSFKNPIVIMDWSVFEDIYRLVINTQSDVQEAGSK